MSRRRAAGVQVRACAKVNLSLRVLALRADGYHELRTTFQSIALHDTLVFTPAAGPLQLSCDDAACPSDRRNLVWRAAECLWRAAGRRGAPSGLAIRIEKRIPMQAGLGGGSSDAAAALRALNRIWRAGLSDTELHACARTLGADVPYFLAGGRMLGVDRGDLLFPLIDGPPLAVVLVQPAFGVSTADAYRWWDESHGSRPAARRRRQVDLEALALPEWGNDLEPPVVERHAEIGRLVRRLGDLGALGAAMSGSGSAVFGLFATPAVAFAAASALHRPSRIVTVTATIGRREYAERHRPLPTRAI